MTVTLMHQVTKEQIGRLHPLTKRELRAYIANRLTVIINNADLIVDRQDGSSIDLALIIAKSGREFMKEVDELLAERNPDQHLGSERD